MMQRRMEVPPNVEPTIGFSTVNRRRLLDRHVVGMLPNNCVREVRHPVTRCIRDDNSFADLISLIIENAEFQSRPRFGDS